MNILLLRGFNNYFNRVVKKYSTLAGYKTNSASYLDLANINFNPNDGVATELIIGSTNQKENNAPLKWDEIGTPDYAICYEMEGSPAAAVIKFRWFVLESERTRNGQYRIALKRDVIADHLEEVLNAPCFIEKGNITSNSDPLLFNKENMSFNQIKQSELLLKDGTGCGWIVGYVTQDKTRYPSGSSYYESTSPVATYEDYSSVPAEIIRLASVGTFQRPVAIATTSWGTPAGRCRMSAYWRAYSDPDDKFQKISFTNVPWAEDITYSALSTTEPNGYFARSWNGQYEVTSATEGGAGSTALMGAIRNNSTLRSYYVNNILTNGEDFDASTQQLIEAWNGRYFKNGTKTYKIKYEVLSGRTMGPDWAINQGTTYYTTLTNIFDTVKNNTGGYFFTGGTSQPATSTVLISGPSSGAKFCDLSWEYYTARVSFVEVAADAGDKVKTYIPADRIQACDTPMDIFAIPYSDEFVVYTGIDAETGDVDPSSGFTMSKQVALQAAISLAQAGDVVYDIQILPYFPNPSMVDEDEGIYNNQVILPFTPFVEDTHYNFYYNTAGTKIGIIFWSRTSTFTVDINEQLSLPSTDALTLKMSNECDLFRLTSPNYAGSFEFSLAKSGGRITKFNADCTYKPYSPYIHVTPDLAGLYGENFSSIDDARGLLCGGDFSITKIVNQWQQYELQNKNYQNIFDRQIQNLDINNKIAMEQQDFQNMNSIANVFTNTLNPISAIGAFVKTGITNPLMSEVGAIKQTDWLQRQQAESKSYTQDMYGYQLGNIKALPLSLSRTAAQTNNNKIFPFVEYFTATQNEKDALEEKLKYNGMTVMKISNLSNYASSADFDKVYVKGQLIRLEDINDDFHIIDAIYQEVNKGFYIPQ